MEVEVLENERVNEEDDYCESYSDLVNQTIQFLLTYVTLSICKN